MMCRLCLSESVKLLDMCKLYYGETPAITYIVEVLDIKVDSENTKLSMCSDCNVALSNFHSFCRVVREAQHRYNEMFDIKPSLAAENKCLKTYCMKKEIADDEDECEEFEEIPINIEDVIECKLELSDYKFDSPSTSNVVTAWSPGGRSLSDDGDEASNVSDNNDIEKVRKNTKALKKTMMNILKKHKKESVDDVVVGNKKKRNTFLRQKMASKTLLNKYKMEELCKGKEWVLTEKQREEMLPLFADMQCTRCDTSAFTTYTLLEKHSMKEHGVLPILDCCRVKNVGRVQLETHILFRHILHRRIPRQKKYVLCHVCNKLIDYIHRREHLSTHLPNEKRKFQCDHCKRGFNKKYLLIVHMSAKHSGQKVPCEVCGKQLCSTASLKAHMKLHSTEPINHCLCPECGKKLKHNESLQNHIKAHHHAVEKVKCHICSSVVRTSYFKRHLAHHNPDKKKDCPYCPYKSYNIQDHIKRVHDKDKRFICSYCAKAFHIEKGLKDHISSQHTGVPGYSCEFCDKTFMSSANCYTHMKRIHPIQLNEKKIKRENEINSGNICDATKLMVSKRKFVEGKEADLLIQNLESIKSFRKPVN